MKKIIIFGALFAGVPYCSWAAASSERANSQDSENEAFLNRPEDISWQADGSQNVANAALNYARNEHESSEEDDEPENVNEINSAETSDNAALINISLGGRQDDESMRDNSWEGESISGAMVNNFNSKFEHSEMDQQEIFSFNDDTFGMSDYNSNRSELSNLELSKEAQSQEESDGNMSDPRNEEQSQEESENNEGRDHAIHLTDHNEYSSEEVERSDNNIDLTTVTPNARVELSDNDNIDHLRNSRHLLITPFEPIDIPKKKYHKHQHSKDVQKLKRARKESKEVTKQTIKLTKQTKKQIKALSKLQKTLKKARHTFKKTLLEQNKNDRLMKYHKSKKFQNLHDDDNDYSTPSFED